MSIEWLGYSAAAVIAITQIPQLLKVVRTKDTEGLSAWTYALITAGCVLYIPYALAIHSIPVALTNAVLTASAATILGYIIAQRRRGRRS